MTFYCYNWTFSKWKKSECSWKWQKRRFFLLLAKIRKFIVLFFSSLHNFSGFIFNIATKNAHGAALRKNMWISNEFPVKNGNWGLQEKKIHKKIEADSSGRFFFLFFSDEVKHERSVRIEPQGDIFVSWKSDID